MCVDSDTSGAAAAAASNERIANRQLDLQEELIPWYKDRQAKLDDLTSEATTAQLGIMRQQSEQSDDYFNYAKETFRPVEQSLVAEAMRESTPEAYARFAAESAARVGSSFRNVMGAAERNMRSMGVNPAGRSGVNRAAMMDVAAASGAEFNRAFTAAKDRGFQMRMATTNLGRNLPQASTAAAAAGSGAGSAATGAANDANRTAGSTIGSPVQYGQLGASYMGNAVSGWNTVAANGGGGLDPGLGALIGVGISKYSSKKLKTNKKPMSDKEVLRGIQRTPSEKWEYEEGTVADDGGQPHTGPYAEDMHREFGVGDGTMLDPMDTAGIALRGVQALTNELAEIKAQLGIKRSGGSDGARA